MRATTRWTALAATLLFGCGASDEEAGRFPGPVGHAIQPVIGGSPSGAEHDAVVALAVFQNGARRGLCSATLVAPNLLLTARHCVSATDTEAACYTDGSAIIGAGLNGDFAAKELAVYVAKNGITTSIDDEAQATARGAKLIVDDTAKTICNRDLAFVLLDRAVAGPIAKLRLGGPTPTEKISIVGWGVTETGALPKQRMERSGVPLIGSGPMLNPRDVRYGIGDAEFMVGESACLGDSGGPALTSTGTVIGVASRAGNGKPRDPSNLASSCTGDAAQATYTHLAGATSLIARAFVEAGVSPNLESSPLEETAPGFTDPATSALDRAVHRDQPPAREILKGTTSAGVEPAVEESACSASSSPISSTSGGARYVLFLAASAIVVARRRGARRDATRATRAAP